MTTLTCPNCRNLLEVTDLGPAPTASEEYRDTVELASPLEKHQESINAYRAVSAMVDRLGREGVDRITSRDVLDYYNEKYVVDKAPRLSPAGLAQALKACGCGQWRTGKARGYSIPDRSSLQHDQLGTVKHIPHVKGRSHYNDIVAYHAIARLPDGTPVFDNDLEMHQ